MNMWVKRKVRGIQSRTSADKSRANILKNEFLSESYIKIYRAMDTSKNEVNSILELGSAGGIAKFYNSRIITSDIRPAEGVDQLFSALELPFKSASMDQIWAKDVLHHLEDPHKFFEEAKRVLKPGGSLSIAETYWGPIAKLIYKYLHPEIYNRSKIESGIFTHEGNQALAEGLFDSDSLQFKVALEGLEEIHRELVNGPAWLLSGGATLSTPFPVSILKRIMEAEKKFQVLKPFWSLNIVVVFRKVALEKV